jgi:hypothetical protein
VTPFRKYEDVIPTIHGLSCKCEALAEAGLSGKGKKIQKRDSHYPFNPVEDSAKEIPFSGRIPQRLESFASGRCRELVSKTSRQGGEDETNINISDVISNDEHRTLHAS